MAAGCMLGSRTADNVDTYFAPAGRAGDPEIQDAQGVVEREALFRILRDSVDGYLVILNRQRQVLTVNRQFLELVGAENVGFLIGGRPGEVLGCIHANKGPDGCGTSRACRPCGATQAIMASQASGESQVRECALTVRRGSHAESFEFRVRATPARIGDHEFTILIYSDISAEKRREALEHTFFHDIMNTIGGLMGWSKVLERLGDQDPQEVARRIVELSQLLAEEIEDQRNLMEAERGNLVISTETRTVSSILHLLESVFSRHGVADGRELEFVCDNDEETVTTDPLLLVRVLTNMVKNALEATDRNQKVRVGYEKKAGAISFFVHNPGCIPQRIASRIFQRSLSTKAEKGRGIGTYSMKLFGEKYLGGIVEFESSAEAGTVFSVRLPAVEV